MVTSLQVCWNQAQYFLWEPLCGCSANTIAKRPILLPAIIPTQNVGRLLACCQTQYCGDDAQKFIRIEEKCLRESEGTERGLLAGNRSDSVSQKYQNVVRHWFPPRGRYDVCKAAPRQINCYPPTLIPDGKLRRMSMSWTT